VLINPARNPSIFRRQFPIRLWYPSQHLLRHNPLPGSQFGGETSSPSQVYLAGMSPFCLNAGEFKVIAMTVLPRRVSRTVARRMTASLVF
jgi:hypothetical protein